MPDGIYAALSGGVVQMRRLEVLANNLANVSTTGFKRDRLVVAERQGQSGEDDPFSVVLDRSRTRAASAAEERGTYVDMSQGPILRTENPLDVAIGGEGFFVLETPEGPRLTRDGRLALAADGTLLGAGGFAVQGEWGPVTVDSAESLAIQPDGEVLADGISVGRLRVARPNAPDAMTKVGDGMWDPGPKGFADISDPDIHQGFIEGSNVEPVTTLVELIQAQRSFDASQQMIRAHKDMDHQSIRKLGTPR